MKVMDGSVNSLLSLGTEIFLVIFQSQKEPRSIEISEKLWVTDMTSTLVIWDQVLQKPRSVPNLRKHHMFLAKNQIVSEVWVRNAGRGPCVCVMLKEKLSLWAADTWNPSVH